MKTHQVLKLVGLLCCTAVPLFGAVVMGFAPAAGGIMLVGGFIIGVPLFIVGRVMESL